MSIVHVSIYLSISLSIYLSIPLLQSYTPKTFSPQPHRNAPFLLLSVVGSRRSVVQVARFPCAMHLPACSHSPGPHRYMSLRALYCGMRSCPREAVRWFFFSLGIFCCSCLFLFCCSFLFLCSLSLSLSPSLLPKSVHKHTTHFTTSPPHHLTTTPSDLIHLLVPSPHTTSLPNAPLTAQYPDGKKLQRKKERSKETDMRNLIQSNPIQSSAPTQSFAPHARNRIAVRCGAVRCDASM